jgi:dipeptide/tripeptide permease
MTSLSYFASAFVSMYIDHYRTRISIFWQVPQTWFMSVAHMQISIAGLEFVYTHSAKQLRSTLASFWIILSASGNIVVAALALALALALVKPPSSSDVFLFYGALMLGMFVVYVLCACLWDEKKFYRDSYSSHIKPAN